MVDILKSFKVKVKTFIFKSDSDGPRVNTGIKRKRPLEDCVDVEEDVQCTSVKKPRLQGQSSSNLFRKILSTNIVQNMSDWVQRKTPTLNPWRSEPTGTKNKIPQGNGFDWQRRSDLSTKLDSNGGSHHRFQTVDMSGAYTKGSWPIIERHKAEGLGRRSIHSHATKSTLVQTDTLSDTHLQDMSHKKDSRGKFARLFKTRNQHRFSAGESVRLGDKVRYQQLLQQFTTVPLKPPEISQPVTIQQPVVVPKLPRFFCNRNDSVLGSNMTSWHKQETQSPDKQKIKVHPSMKPSSRTTVNGSAHEDSFIYATDISPIPAIPRDKSEKKQSYFSQQKVIDLTEDEEVQIISEERPSSREKRQSSLSLNRTKSPISDYRDSKFISEDWIKDLHKTYGAKSRERQRKIAEEEMRTKLLAEERHKQEIDLERKIRQQMRIFAKEPGVTEEPEPIEIESSEEDEEEEESLPELTDAMENKVNNSLRGGSPGEVLVDKFRQQITRADIATLSGLKWLNDEIINFYMNLLMERGEKDGMPKVYAFNTFFYPKVMSGGQSSVRRWTRKVDVLAVDYIIVPVHLGMHWCLSVINFKKKDIQYYDSMGGCNTECLNALKKYLCDESLDKKKKEFNLNGWTSTIVKDIPQQMNGSDCGMFACKFADYITREKPFTFSQQHMPYFRRRMVYEIVTAKLLQ